MTAVAPSIPGSKARSASETACGPAGDRCRPGIHRSWS